jgi:hypothetical protein
MSDSRWRVAVAAVVVAAVVVTAVMVLTTGGSGQRHSASTSTRSAVLPDGSYKILWAGTQVGQSEPSVLARWPKNPYQHYSDNLREDCYEWEDEAAGPDKHMPAHLYNLCFKDGVLRLKTVF